MDHKTGQAYRFNSGFYADGSPAPRDGSIEDGLRLLEAATDLAGHNIISYDVPVLTKLYPWFAPKGRLHDTLIIARLIYPHLYDIDKAAIRKGQRPPEFTGQMIGAHKLEVWGLRLGVLKGSYTGGWTDFTPDMDHYGAQDVVVTRALLNLIQSKEFSQEAMDLECDAAAIIHRQERFGFLFDAKAAEKLEGQLRVRIAVLGDQLRAAFPPWVEPLRKGGVPVIFVPKRDNKKLGYIAGVGVPKFQTISFNPGSRDHIANRMITLFGWMPVDFTPSGKPEVSETTLSGLDYPEAKLMVEYLTTSKVLGQLSDGKQSWQKAVKADGRIHGRVQTLGAITRRMSHSNPPMAGTPKVKHGADKKVLLGYAGAFGFECRSLFIVGPDNLIMGCDAEGLELRMLAHYMAKYDGGEYAKAVVDGNKKEGTDAHTINQRLLGMDDRENAKTFVYAYLYGAGLLKLGMILYDDFGEEKKAKFHAKFPAGTLRETALARMGKRGRTNLETGLPALAALQASVKRIASSGRIKSVDGGLIRVRSAHSALNTVLQGGGAVVLKKALIIFDNALISEFGFKPNIVTGAYATPCGGTFGHVANIHDEFQTECPAHLAQALGRRAALAIQQAGEAFNLRCPLGGAFQTGLNWSDSH